MIELLNLIVVVSILDAPAAGFMNLGTGTGSLLWLLVAVLVLMALVACGWMLLALGVRIGRSLERHASLMQQNAAALETPLRDAIPIPGTAVAPVPVDSGLPLVPPDLHQEMVRDTLTGLWTRDAVLDLLRRELSRAIRQNVPFGLVLAKLDHFDELTREKGDAVSEAVLKTASEHFIEGLREYDSAGRSGAEFLLILPGWDPDSDPKRVEGLLAPIRMKPGTGEESLQITASIGVASFRPLSDSPYAEDLLQRADMAVHAAQAAGRNRAEFAPR